MTYPAIFCVILGGRDRETRNLEKNEHRGFEGDEMMIS